MPAEQTRRERFEELFRAHYPAVRRYVQRRARPEAVDDIVSDTFLVAWRRLDRVPEEPLPWLLTVARNTLGTERRGAARRARLRLKAQSAFTESYDLTAIDEHDGPVVLALSRLSPRDREALMLVAWDELRPAEAAKVLGIPAGRFRVHLHRAGRRLRAQLEDLDVPTRGRATDAPQSDHCPRSASEGATT